MRLVKWNKQRKFGLEYEFTRGHGNREGLARAIQTIPDQVTEIAGYVHNHNNSEWFCKTDSSCGLEVASPVLHGPRQLKMACDVLTAIQNAGFNYSDQCGNHVHVSTQDFSMEQIKVLSMYWVKIEKVLMHSEPHHRRSNSYCTQSNTRCTTFEPNRAYTPEQVYARLRSGRDAINFAHVHNGKIEFRFGDMTYDTETIKNRVRFLIWFVDMVKILPAPPNLNWYSPKQVLRLLGLWQDENSLVKREFSPAIRSMRRWLLTRLQENIPQTHYSRDHESVTQMLNELDNEDREDCDDE